MQDRIQKATAPDHLPVQSARPLVPGVEGAMDPLRTDNLATGAGATFEPTTHRLSRGKRRLPREGDCLEDFELLRLLGKGSFGHVFLARQVSLNRQVALKVTLDGGHEGRTLASLEHDHIVKVFSEKVDRNRGLRLLCMQFVPGTTLEKVLRALKPEDREGGYGQVFIQVIDRLSNQPSLFHPAALRDRDLLARCDFPQAVCWLGARLAEALDYAHSQGVLHCDVKPANVLLTPFGRPMLVDFNLGLDLHRISTQGLHRIGGTLAYMAPEHLDAFVAPHAVPPGVVDRRLDVYSLGVVLFETFTGQRPSQTMMHGEGEPETCLLAMAAERRKDPPRLRPLNPAVPAVLERIVRRCLAPDPNQRYQTAGELARALDGAREVRRTERELPAPGVLTRLALARPFLWLVLLTFLPHVLGSLVNIGYNVLVIVKELSDRQQEAFRHFVLGYNLIVYPLCLAVVYRHLHPVVRAWRILTRDEPLTSMDAAQARQRVLTLPLAALVLSCLGWLPGGILFPLGLHLFVGPVTPTVFGHFAISFTVSGLIAVTYSCFSCRYLSLRVLYPQLWTDAQRVCEIRAEELSATSRRRWVFPALAGIIPLIGAILLVARGPESHGGQEFRLFSTLLILLGMVGFIVAMSVDRLLTQVLGVLGEFPDAPTSARQSTVRIEGAAARDTVEEVVPARDTEQTTWNSDLEQCPTRPEPSP